MRQYGNLNYTTGLRKHYENKNYPQWKVQMNKQQFDCHQKSASLLRGEGEGAFYFVWIDDTHIVIFTQGSRACQAREDCL